MVAVEKQPRSHEKELQKFVWGDTTLRWIYWQINLPDGHWPHVVYVLREGKYRVAEFEEENDAKRMFLLCTLKRGCIDAIGELGKVEFVSRSGEINNWLGDLHSLADDPPWFLPL